MKLFQKLIESVKQWVLLVPTLRNIQDFIWFSSLGGSFLNGFLGLDWNDKFGVNAKFKCLEKWFRSYASVMILTIYILLGSHPMVIKLSWEKNRKIIQCGSCSAGAPLPCPWPSQSPCPRSRQPCPEKTINIVGMRPSHWFVFCSIHISSYPMSSLFAALKTGMIRRQNMRGELYTLPCQHINRGQFILTESILPPQATCH